MSKKLLLWPIGGIIIAAVAGMWFWKMSAVPSQKIMVLKKVTIAVSTQPISALIYIAQAKNYFKDQGLDVTLQPYSTGKEALQATADGNADLGTVADTPFVLWSLNNKVKVDMVSAIGTSQENIAVIGRKDRGILVPTDLKGKNIGVTLGTNAQYFLDLFLQINGVKKSEVNIINFTPAQTVDALAGGQIDAFCAWNPVLINLQKKIGDNGVTFYNQDVYSYLWGLVARQDYIRQNKAVVERVATALIEAEKFVKDNEGESQAVVAGTINMDLGTLREIWKIYKFENTLSQRMLLGVQSQARWAIENNLTTVTQIPDYIGYIYFDALEKVKPEAVTIIHE